MIDDDRKEQALQYLLDGYKILFAISGGFAAGWIASNNATMEMYQSEILYEGVPTPAVPEIAYWAMAPGIFYLIWVMLPWPGKGDGLTM